MATSGSVNFNQTRDDLINASLRKLGIVAQGEDPAAYMTANGADDFNRMIKAWMAHGIHLWTYDQGIVFPEADKQSFNLGPTGDRAASTFVATEIAVAALLGASTITVDDDTGMTSGDNIGIELDDGTLQWTTINGAPSSNVVTLTATLTAAVAVNNNVYTYTTLINRPTEIRDARLSIDLGNEIPIEKISNDSYFNLPNKSESGLPTQFYYDPQLTNGVLYLWPVFDSVANTVLFTFERPLEDVDSITDNADFPQEWLEAIVYNLAVRLAPEYGALLEDRQMLQQEASIALELAKSWDQEHVNVDFQPSHMSIEGWE